MPLDVDKIKSLREKRGLSLDDAGNQAGLGGLREWLAVEKGVTDLSISQLDRVAEVLGVEAADLLVAKGKRKK